MTQPTNKSDVDRLNAMLRGERAAVETYGKCIEKLATSSRVAGASPGLEPPEGA